MSTSVFRRYSVIDGIHRNILDNAYFVGGGSQANTGKFPVNQRQASSYSAAGYSIDRWILSANATLTLPSTGAKLTKTGSAAVSLIQKLEYTASAPVTFSALVKVDLKAAGSADAGNLTLSLKNSSGSDISGATVSQTASSTSTMVLLTKTYTGGTAVAQFAITLNASVPTNGYVEVIACKLEPGRHQTLAHRENGAWVLNEIPNPTEEWMRCQRFFHFYTNRPTPSTNKWQDQIPVMRVDPNVTYSPATNPTQWFFDADL